MDKVDKRILFILSLPHYRLSAVEQFLTCHGEPAGSATLPSRFDVGSCREYPSGITTEKMSRPPITSACGSALMLASCIPFCSNPTRTKHRRTPPRLPDPPKMLVPPTEEHRGEHGWLALRPARHRRAPNRSAQQGDRRLQPAIAPEKAKATIRTR